MLVFQHGRQRDNMRISEIAKVTPFTGKQHRQYDELTGRWVDHSPPEYMVVFDDNGKQKAIATYTNERDAVIRSKKEKLLGKKNVEIMHL